MKGPALSEEGARYVLDLIAEFRAYMEKDAHHLYVRARERSGAVVAGSADAFRDQGALDMLVGAMKAHAEPQRLGEIVARSRKVSP